MAESFPFSDTAGSFSALSWPTTAPIQGVLHILHGMAEHPLRYEKFAHTLNQRGIKVYAHAHPGHGPQAGDSQGHFGDTHGWSHVLQRVHHVRDWLHARHPECPHAILGHSMGSFIALSYLSQHTETLAGLWLSGSTSPTLAEVFGGRIAAYIECMRQGVRGKSWLLDKLSFSSFNRAFLPARTPFDWLSRDPQSVDRYIADPLCGFRCSNQLWLDFLQALWVLFAQGGLSRLPKSLPVILLSGSQDPVGGTKGVLRLEQRLKKAGMQHVQAHLFPDCRHELLQELNKEEVSQFLGTSLLAHIAAIQATPPTAKS